MLFPALGPFRTLTAERIYKLMSFRLQLTLDFIKPAQGFCAIRLCIGHSPLFREIRRPAAMTLVYIALIHHRKDVIRNSDTSPSHIV